MGRIEATEGGPLTVGYQVSCRHLIQGGTCPAGHHEGSVLESGEWVTSIFRCAANVAER